MLREQHKHQLELQLLAGSSWNNHFNLVFTNELGENISHSMLAHRFKRIMRTLELPDVRFHDLRHTYAVTALQAGIDIKTVQESLGHQTASFTLDIYGHMTEHMAKDAASKIDSFINGVSNL